MGKGILVTVLQPPHFGRIKFVEWITVRRQILGVGLDAFLFLLLLQFFILLLAEALDQLLPLHRFLHLDPSVVEIAEQDMVEGKFRRQKDLFVILAVIAADPVTDQESTDVAQQLGRVGAVFVFPGAYDLISHQPTVTTTFVIGLQAEQFSLLEVVQNIAPTDRIQYGFFLGASFLVPGLIGCEQGLVVLLEELQRLLQLPSLHQRHRRTHFTIVAAQGIPRTARQHKQPGQQNGQTAPFK